MWTRPTVDEFKAYFFRDFNYAPTSDPNDLKYITDPDITKAMDQAEATFNSRLFGNDAGRKQAFLLLAACYMVSDIQTSTQGLSSQFNFPVSSKSVGGVSIGYSIPKQYLDDTFVSFLASNGYGVKYFQLAQPWTVGRVGIIDGTTTQS